MKILWLLILTVLMIPIIANAGETKILYHQKKIPGPQITKDYYVKESVKRVDPKNPNILQVKTYTTVTSPEGTTKYRMTSQFNCATQTTTIVAYWSSGYGNDNGTMVNGKWRNIADFSDAVVLSQKICRKK
jgi:hypothetical protein